MTIGIRYPMHMDIKQEIIDKGWLEIDFPIECHLFELANVLGNIVPQPNGKFIAELLQKPSEKQGNSLSSRFGYGEFPLHTDGVGMPLPPLLILLRVKSEDSSMQPTRIATIKWPNESSKKYELLAETQMVVNVGSTRFYSPIINRKTSRRAEFIRYNPSCMTAPQAGSDFVETLDCIIKNAQVKDIFWKTGTVIALNNWRILHGRGNVTNVSNIGNRTLERCWIR
jgi:hypothetical protein